MAGISSLSASSPKSLFDYLQNSSTNSGTTDATQAFDAISAAKPSQAGPEGFLSNELQQQGYTGSALEDLLEKIHAAVQSVPKDSSGRPDRNAIHDAVNQVLKDAGVDTDKIDSDFKAKGLAHHHHAGGKPAAADDIDAILEGLGVDPAKFKSALQSALQNAGTDGSIDLSQLFASAAVGSQVDLHA